MRNESNLTQKRKYNYADKVCSVCSTVFKPTNGNNLTCGLECSKKFRSRNYTKWSRKYRQKLRRRVIEAYGNKCNCCGESIFEFLTLDHVNNDGAAHRKALFPNRKTRTSDPASLCLWIVKNNFPNTIQVLCYNCNSAKGFLGRCPHEGSSPSRTTGGSK